MTNYEQELKKTKVFMVQDRSSFHFKLHLEYNKGNEINQICKYTSV